MPRFLIAFLALLLPLAADPKPLKPAPPPGPNSGMLPVAQGPFQPSWDSLKQYKCPEWFRDAKFGVWACWNAYCVPEQGDWYARLMYIQDGKIEKSKHSVSDYEYQIAHYGHPSKVGFKDIDNMWHGENWNPTALMALYKAAGAKYFVSMANHHDNFDCFDSKYQPWNSVNIGPKKDIVGDWAKVARADGLHFGVSVHAGRSWSWFNVSHGADKTGSLAGVPYDGNLTEADGKGQWWEGYDPAQLYGPAGAARTPAALTAYNVKFYNRTIDLVSKYKPDLLYFDDAVMPLANQPGDYGLKLAADFYNSSIQWHGQNEGVFNTKKLNADQAKCVVHDIERGQRPGIEPVPWQTDTCIGDWAYSRPLFERHKYKTPSSVILMLIDIVSKNGNLLLSVPVRGDGTLDEDETALLHKMAGWMTVNGEAIFSSRPWKIYGEGPSTARQEANRYGGVKDIPTKPYTQEDFRFTTKGTTLYAICLATPKSQVMIKSLGSGSPQTFAVGDVQLLGGGKLAWKQTPDGLVITCPKKMPTDIASAFKITPKT